MADNSNPINRYERPNQTWVCGRACSGESCMIGPDEKGNCRATSECQPLRKGDRWVCTRPDRLGGPCPDGPLPNGACARPIPKCEPRRSYRSLRGLASLFVAGVTAVWLALILTTHAGREVISPGELSSAHSTSKSDCTDCHAAAFDKPIAWMDHAKLASNEANGLLCMKCHQVGVSPFNAHGQNPSTLKAIRAERRSAQTSATPANLRLATTFVHPPSLDDSFNCSTCHKEHLGKQHDLTQIANLQCQSCHAVQFASFADGHPDFAGYPFTRRTRLVFDHNTHFKTHFRDDKFKDHAPDSCTSCHTPGPRGRVMVVKSFEQTCAACHDDQIHGVGRAGALGIAVFRLPGLDVQSLNDKNLSVGEWPEFAEGKLTPFMEILLARQPEVDAAIKKLGKQDLLDLGKADVATLKAANTLGWAVKELYYDLASKGQAELFARIQADRSKKLTADELAHITGLLSPDVITGAIGQWFPNLNAEIAARRSNAKLPAVETKKSNQTQAIKGVKPDAWVETGGWYRSDADYTISYRPRGHADDFLTGWLTVAANSSNYQHTQVADRLFHDLASPKAPGMCTKCHSVDEGPARAVNWHGARPNLMEHSFTKFSHSSHFSLLNDQGCMTCHTKDETPDAYLAAFESNPSPPASKFHGNFKPIQKSTCASCHTPQLAGDSCLLCHNYHIGMFEPTARIADKVRVNPPLKHNTASVTK